ncbi:MAG: RnfABCDGE type electron transport complex subunit D [Oscillospiraceae bacterium]|nr:RnfABCDGE type electron transport complex subunit D [Oscillospiraceae bacterium]MCD8066479.1 RnfABCDGE type electron transport complex subunit D [Oscillospiraceae bacterium]
MDNTMVVSVSPHLRAKEDTRNVMRDVVIALLPAVVASVIIFGFRALLVECVCVATAVICEWAFEKITKRQNTVRDLSAVVTGLLLAMNLPVSIPIWQAIFGSFVAIIFVKQLFGGIGQNFANPAITARIIMFIAFSGTMSSWAVPSGIGSWLNADAVTSATPLRLLELEQYEDLPSVAQMFLGWRGGCLGETSCLALLIGGIYLIVRRVITWHTPVVYLATVFVLTALLGESPVYQLLGGGIWLGAIFMATDYVTSPPTPAGKIIFGLGCGLITVLIRVYGSYPEGCSFSILLMNILSPYISKWTQPKPFGGVKA